MQKSRRFGGYWLVCWTPTLSLHADATAAPVELLPRLRLLKTDPRPPFLPHILLLHNSKDNRKLSSLVLLNDRLSSHNYTFAQSITHIEHRHHAVHRKRHLQDPPCHLPATSGCLLRARMRRRPPHQHPAHHPGLHSRYHPRSLHYPEVLSEDRCFRNWLARSSAVLNHPLSNTTTTFTKSYDSPHPWPSTTLKWDLRTVTPPSYLSSLSAMRFFNDDYSILRSAYF
ncbi:hypothetical protein FJTKL_03932 [Diaporthe vaccinii]|uniref:Uncharacterized protein n=1 Tax=Diaporthe vaccinii TaxID=105482 RepID=A0ABR4F1K3_9PEZI